jgi:hypothetical protein
MPEREERSSMSDTPHNPDQPNRQWNADEAVRQLADEHRVMGRDGDTYEQQAARLLQEALPGAVLAVTHIAQYSQDEALRFRAAAYVVDRNLGRITDRGVASDDTTDPLEAFAKRFEAAENA